MLNTTKGIVLRSVKYGETSLILSIFTERFGLQSYIIKGVRSEKTKSKRAGLLQIGSLIEIVAEHKPNRQLQHIREFQPSYIYQSLQEEIIKNSIATFSVESLIRLLPQEETMDDLYQFAENYLIDLDTYQLHEVANFPLFFCIQCGKYFGYNILGNYSEETPYLNASEGIFTTQPPLESSSLNVEDVRMLNLLLNVQETGNVSAILLNSAARNRLLDWYILFLQHHTQHLKNLRSLEILRIILH